MENDKSYFQVGMFVILMILTAMGSVMWFTCRTNEDYSHYFIRFAESVSGLNKESVVKFRGVDVGNVKKIFIDPHDSKMIRVNINVLESTPIKTDTTATLKLYGVTGEVYIELSGGGVDSSKLDKKKDEHAEIKAKPSEISTVVNSIPKLLEKANHAADQINKIFSDENVHMINSFAKKISQHYGIK